MNRDELRSLQLSELEILQMFKQLCESNHLRFYITAGTLLGAVRHQGFIPWDDDIDVVMPRKDYDKLRDICKSELPSDYYFQDSFTEENFPYFFSKIRKCGTEVYEPCLDKVNIRKGIYIDILPLDACPKRDKSAYIFFKFIGLFSSVYMGKVNADFVCGYTKKYIRFLYSILVKLPLTTIRSMRENAVRFCGKFCDWKRLCTVGGAHGYPAETYDAAWFDGEMALPFEGHLFPVPVGWDQLLKNMYGNYMQSPDEENRKGHFE